MSSPYCGDDPGKEKLLGVILFMFPAHAGIFYSQDLNQELILLSAVVYASIHKKCYCTHNGFMVSHDTMRVIAKRTLREFWEKHSSARQPLLSWYKAVQTAGWQNSAELKEQFSTASIINATRVVFNIGGNTYRLICIVRFDKQIIFVRFIGTHQEYDKINAAEV